MMALTHIVVSAGATSLMLSTANPVLIAVGALTGLLPDVDISTSWAGRVFPWVAHWLERRFPHRSCTHSLVASTALAAVTYSIVFLIKGQFLLVADVINIGYLFGWLLDMFSKSGVEMFWPSTERYVCPGNRNFRLKTGSPAEYIVLMLLMAIAVLIFNINASGGLMTQFNRLIASPVGVQEIYNQSGSTHLVMAHIKGVRSLDRSPVEEDFTIIQAQGEDFIVKSSAGKMYKVGSDSTSQIIPQHMTADVKTRAITNVEPMTLDDEPFTQSIQKFQTAGAMIFVSGQVTIDDPQGVNWTPDPYQFPFIKLSGSSLTLENAPLSILLSYFSDQYATGQLQIRIIHEASTTGNT
jgi:inner membrane protein